MYHSVVTEFMCTIVLLEGCGQSLLGFCVCLVSMHSFPHFTSNVRQTNKLFLQLGIAVSFIVLELHDMTYTTVVCSLAFSIRRLQDTLIASEATSAKNSKRTIRHTDVTQFLPF